MVVQHTQLQLHTLLEKPCTKLTDSSSSQLLQNSSSLFWRYCVKPALRQLCSSGAL